MVLLPSDHRGGIESSHPQTVQKMQNNNCSHTKETFVKTEQTHPSLWQQVELSHHVSLNVHNKGFMQCPISNGKPSFMNFCCPPRPDISSWSKAFGPLSFLCASQMAQEDTKKNQQGTSLLMNLNHAKPKWHFSKFSVSCGIPKYWPNILGNWALRKVLQQNAGKVCQYPS